jgi:hypothetical protein
MKALVLAFALLLGATTVLFAQSLPNYGPNAPATGDGFGKPYSGAKPLRSGAHAYAYQRRSHHYHYRHSRHPYEQGAPHL